jgi:single-strand DNA-binding protein
MAGSVNRVTILGNLGRDPEVRTFGNGGKLVNLSIATSETWRDKASGDRKEKTEWHRVTITNEALCRIAEQYLTKGSTVYIEGQIETRKWQDQSGADKFSTEIMVKPFNGVLTLLSGKPGGGSDGGTGQSQGYDQSPPVGQAQREGGGRTDMDDSIPF